MMPVPRRGRGWGGVGGRHGPSPPGSSASFDTSIAASSVTSAAGSFPSSALSRDHVRPFCQGGKDVWNNVVAACRRCNNHKASRTPEQAGMQLLAVPFTPTYAEYIYLKGRRVLADQMGYLLAHFPRSSPLHARIKRFRQ